MNIFEVMILELNSKQQRLTNDIMGYKELLHEGIIIEKEYSIKEKELLFFIRKRIK